jgi:hypothetical protein
MAYRNQFYTPKQDTGWGLIFRLNGILEKIETDVENGNMDRWNLHLDRVYANIIYKNKEEIIQDQNGKIVDFQLTKIDTDVFSKVNEIISKLKKDIHILQRSEDEDDKILIGEKKRQLYNVIFKKDVWVRKKMFQLGLYLQKVEHDPSKALYGG